MTKALITGVTGFAGSHLAEFLLAKKYSVTGLHRRTGSVENIAHITDRLTLYECDIRDAARLAKVVAQTEPDEIYHLVAIAQVPASHRDPRLTFEVNLHGSLNLFEAVKAVSREIKVLYVGSAHEYGHVTEKDIPINEDVPLRPTDPYSVSKASADMLAFQYACNFHMPIVRVRPFNHIGPRQSPAHAVPSFAKQITAIEKGVAEPVIDVGNLEAKRDFTDVRDMVEAYWLVLQEGEPGEVYNVCSGTAISVKELLNQLLDMSGEDIQVNQDPRKLRVGEIPLLAGSSAKIHQRTGWKPKIPLEKTLCNTLNYWRDKNQA